MSDDTQPAALAAAGKKHRLTIDWTVNITSVVSFAVGCITAAGLYFGLSQRIGDIEKMAPIEAAQRKEKDAQVQASLNGLTTDLKDVKTVVDKVSRQIEVQNAVAAAEAKDRRK